MGYIFFIITFSLSLLMFQIPDLSAETKNVIKFVEIALPKITEAEENHEITGKELDSLDDFLKTIEIDDSIEDFLKND